MVIDNGDAAPEPVPPGLEPLVPATGSVPVSAERMPVGTERKPVRTESMPVGAEQIPARIGSRGVYATPTDLVAFHRTRAERAMRTILTFVGVCLATPIGFLIPPHLEPAALVFVLGLYFTRRAWVAEWEVVRMSGTCPRCEVMIELKRGTVLYIPHTIHCTACRAELWLEVSEAPVVDESLRRAAMEQTSAPPPTGELGGRPPQTWSPAASDWRDRQR